MDEVVGAPIELWSAVVASGLYHGLNPAMGWPLAVSAGMMERTPRALAAALSYLAVGHMLAVLAVLLPFALLAALLAWQRDIQIGAGAVLVGFGAFLLVRTRHPRILARIRPARLGLWSFAVAVAHGAGLMLVPIYLGLCGPANVERGHGILDRLIGNRLDMTLIVAAVHTLAMFAAGGLLAWLAYRHLGLRLVARSWFNLDVVWAATLVLVGAISIALTAVAP